MALRLSVVIPTYNGAGRLAVPLGALAAQEGAGPFEVVVVDNASTDGTAEAARGHAAALAARGAELRVVGEPRPGATFARLRGVLEARGELVGFLDDDVAPEPGYLAEAARPFADPAVGLAFACVFPRYTERLPRKGVERRHAWLGCTH